MDFKKSFQNVRKLFDTPGINAKQPKPINQTLPTVEETPIVEETPKQEEVKPTFSKNKNKWTKKS